MLTGNKPAEIAELAAGDMTLRVIDVKDGAFTAVGDMHVASGYIPVDLSWALTDPDSMMLENFETQQEAAAYRVGNNGMPVRK